MKRICIVTIVLASLGPLSARADPTTAPPPYDTPAAQLDRSGAQLTVGGAITLGLGVVFQVAGGVMFGVGANSVDESHNGLAVELTGIPVLAVGMAATVAGATMLGVGASRKHQARKLRASLGALPSIAPLLAADHRALAGAVTSWSLRF